MRILGIDYGERYVGLALSDVTRTMSSPLETIQKPGDYAYKPTLARIKEIVKSENVTLIVLGLPKNMDNTEGKRCEKTRLFKEKLNKYLKKIEVVFVDERFSTNYATSIMRELDYNVKKKEDNIDKISASIILQSFLDMTHHQNH
ncbi:MAG: Holliday junction resolvase RuvX [Lachnospirales bacterium]